MCDTVVDSPIGQEAMGLATTEKVSSVTVDEVENGFTVHVNHRECYIAVDLEEVFNRIAEVYKIPRLNFVQEPVKAE